MPPRLLVIDGNERSVREAHRAATGRAMGENYGKVLADLAAARGMPGLLFDVVAGADAGAAPPRPLADYDGTVISGSHYQLSAREPGALRQVPLARAVLDAGLPFLGSCWGMQVMAVAAGGAVDASPLGREGPIGRNIAPNEEGRRHPLLAGRPAAFDALTAHLDVVTTLPPGARALAANGHCLQAYEIDERGVWVVQYHPELDPLDVAAALRRNLDTLVEEGLAPDLPTAARVPDALEALHRDPARADLAHAFGVAREVLDPAARRTELGNWLAGPVRAGVAARGRA